MKHNLKVIENSRTGQFAPWPVFSQDEIDAVAAVLRSGKVNYWTGEEVRFFEKEFATFTGCEHAIALANGTVALELALYALNIGQGDEVIVPCRTYIASASSVFARGATPVMADVDPVSQNITAAAIERVLTSRTRAVIVVHLAGWPCDMDPILELSQRKGLKVIEDCAQAHGAMYKGRPVGSLGDLAAFSFCQDKIMTTGGEGGMLTTSDRALWERAWAYKDHGKSFEKVSSKQHPPGFRWLHDSFGTNWRLTEMQAAIGRIQLKKLPEWRKQRQQHAKTLNSFFSGFSALRVTPPPPEIEHAYYKYYVFVRPEHLKLGWDRDKVLKEIVALGVPCFSGSCSEIYLEKAFENEGLQPEGRLSTAMELGKTSLMFQVHPTLSRANIVEMCRAVETVLTRATIECSPERANLRLRTRHMAVVDSRVKQHDARKYKTMDCSP
ncbi:MAG: DegT/DnrJ/EryC1/StrS aminotransferase family protein [Geobacteraceae bacterium]|nr:DegT/DnrJ/EryC1/StrS aminotransferase family protein [Geobacteraceae bacterium]